MVMRIWLSVLCGVLTGGSIAYSLTGALLNWGVLVGILAGSAASFVVLSPEYFRVSFRSQLESIDGWYRKMRLEKMAREYRIAQMRAAWIETIPDILPILRFERIKEMRIFAILFANLLFPLLVLVYGIGHAKLGPFSGSTVLLRLLFTMIGCSVLGTIMAMAMAWSWPWRESIALIPRHWYPPDRMMYSDMTQLGWFMYSHRDLIPKARAISPEECWRNFWRNWPKDILFGWFTFAVWPAMKFVVRNFHADWHLIPNILEAGWRVFRYMHTAGHRHVMLHTSLTLAIGIWGFKAPVVPLALIGATVSAILWVFVSRRVFHAA